MSRDSSGNYTLPAGNPVVTNTTITSAWANNTCNDIGAEITNSLDRNGRGGMLAALRIIDGTAGVPALAFSNETGTGFARLSSGAIALILSGVKSIHFGGGFSQWIGSGTNVNGVQITYRASGNTPTFGAFSSVDTNVGLIIDGQGTGRVQVGNQIAGSSAPLFTNNQYGGRFVLKQDGTTINAPNDLTEDTVASIPIFANALGPNGQVFIEPIVLEKISAAADLITIRVRFDGNLIYTFTDSSNTGGVAMQMNTVPIFIANQNAANSQIYGCIPVLPAIPIGTLAVDTTAFKTITITVQKTNVANTVRIRRYHADICPQA